MSAPLPKTVVCSACGHPKPTMQTRRYITLWARPGGGGSLNGIKDQKAHDIFRCDDCVRDGKFAESTAEQEVLL